MSDVKAEIADLKAGMREIYEVWAGSEFCDPLTVPEGYQQHLIEEIRDIAAKYLTIPKDGLNE